MMGQRAALMDAFKLALPGQSQLGGMVRDLHRLQSQVRTISRIARPRSYYYYYYLDAHRGI